MLQGSSIVRSAASSRVLATLALAVAAVSFHDAALAQSRAAALGLFRPSIAQFLIDGDFDAVPKNWTKPVRKSEKLNGVAVTHLSYSLPQVTGQDGKKVPGGTVHLYHRADDTPVKIVVDSSAMKLTVDFAEVKQGAVDSGLFVPGKNYKLRTLGKGEMPPLPGGIPGEALNI